MGRGRQWGGGTDGLVALLGRCQKHKTKHAFILPALAWWERGKRWMHTAEQPLCSPVGLQLQPSVAASPVSLHSPGWARLPSPSWHGSLSCSEQSRHPSLSRR